jgi:hypothetical protein
VAFSEAFPDTISASQILQLQDRDSGYNSSVANYVGCQVSDFACSYC